MRSNGRSGVREKGQHHVLEQVISSRLFSRRFLVPAYATLWERPCKKLRLICYQSTTYSVIVVRVRDWITVAAAGLPCTAVKAVLALRVKPDWTVMRDPSVTLAPLHRSPSLRNTHILGYSLLRPWAWWGSHCIQRHGKSPSKEQGRVYKHLQTTRDI